MALVCWSQPSALAQGGGGVAPVGSPATVTGYPPPDWNPPGGTITPPTRDNPSTATGKNGEVYVWDAKRCRWTYRDKSGPTSPFEHPACGVSGQGLPFGTKSTSPDGSTASDGAGNTYTYDEDTFDNHGNVTKAGKGWVNDKTGASLCTPPANAGVMPGGGGGGGGGSCVKQPSNPPGGGVPMETTPSGSQG